jgi:RNA polymerase sigma-70 factor (ECF subfamily)
MDDEPEELGAWLEARYARSFRTAWLLLRNRDDAQEVVQDAYLRVWRFRTSIPEGDGREAWLYRVVVNTSLSRLRTDKRWRGRDERAELNEQVAPRADEPEQQAVRSALAQHVLAALAALPESLRVPVVLRYYAGLSEREIATAIGRRPGTVKSRLFDARALLSKDPALAAWVQTNDSTGEIGLPLVAGEANEVAST